MAKLILDGFDPRTAQDLGGVLAGQGHQVTIGWQEDDGDSADVLFCRADAPDYPLLVKEIRTFMPDLPVVVVTAHPDPSRWLDALEDGAADYCCAPFETGELSRLLSGVLNHVSPAKPSASSRV